MIRALFVVALLTLQSMALDMDDIKIMRESGVKIAFPNEYKAHTISASTRPADLMRVNYLRLNGQYLRKIPAWLPQMTKLVKLELEDTHIDLIDLFALKPLTNLNTLDLSNNPKLFDKGGSLSKLLSYFSLSELYLNNTGGSSSDYADIGNSTSLIKLDLSDNSISSIDALHLERLKHLKKLTLKNSGLTGTLNTAYLPKSLVKLNLSSNDISRLKYSDDFPLLESLDISMDRSYLKFDEDWDDAYILKRLRSGKFNKDIALPKSIMKRLNIKYFNPTKKICIANGGAIKEGSCIANWSSANNICWKSNGHLEKIENFRKLINVCGKTNKKDFSSLQFSKNGKDDPFKTTCPQKIGFKSGYYWTSTLVSDEAYFIDFDDSVTDSIYIDTQPTTTTYYVKCIR